MRTLKLIGAIIAVLAFGALGAANASAAEKLWKLLPGSVGETFTGSSGAATLTSKGLTIQCTSSSSALTEGSLLEEGSTEKKDATLALVIIIFTGCQSAGLAINSEGSAAKTIRVHLEIHFCFSIGPLYFFLLKLLRVHLVVPAVPGFLILLQGGVIGKFEGTEKTKAKAFGLKVATNASKEQEFTKCEGGEATKLEAAFEGEKFEPATENAAEGKITFDGTKDKEGEEPMV
jgi:hypothetical protein